MRKSARSISNFPHDERYVNISTKSSLYVTFIDYPCHVNSKLKRQRSLLNFHAFLNDMLESLNWFQIQNDENVEELDKLKSHSDIADPEESLKKLQDSHQREKPVKVKIQSI